MTRLHLFLLLICAPFLAAQQLDLDSAIQLAKTNNRTLQNSSKDIQIAKEQRWEAIAIGLPQVSLSAG